MSLSIPLQRRTPGRDRILLATLIPIVAAVAVALYLHVRYPTASPWTSASYLIQNAGRSHARLNRQVIGFLPYWRLDDSRYLRQELLSEVIYFSLTADQSGQLVRSVNGTTEPGWRWWMSSAVRNQIARTQIAGDKFLLSVAMQDSGEIDALLAAAGAQQTLIDNVLDQVHSNRLDGVNLDIEFDGKATEQQRTAFTSFAAKLTEAFHQQAPGAELSIDLPPRAARDQGLYDVPELSSLFDRVIVMSYDYYAARSDVAGPVAPMSGFADHQYYFDVTTTYSDYAKSVSKAKLIMGVPYYGYDWPVKDDSSTLSPTTGQADILSYSRMRTDADLKPASCHWEAAAEETRCTYNDAKTGEPREVWVADARSVAAKYDFAQTQGLSGVAIWALGYDGAYPDLWNLIKSDFT